MSGTFSSFSGALSAIRYNRVAMDVASGNVANANTPGYARRLAVAQSVGAPAVPAVWSRWNGTAGGVEAGGVERMVDPLLDKRSRTEHSSLSHLDTRATSLVRFETTIGEPGEGGVAAALSAFKQGWQDVANNPGDEAARSQLLGRAETLRAAIASQGEAVATEWSDQRVRLDAVVVEANKLAEDLAKLNGALQAAFISDNDAGTLLDQRDQLALRLAQLTGARVSAERDSMFDLTLDGVPLVTGTKASRIEVTGGASIASPPPLAISVTVPPSVTPTPTTGPLRGELGGTVEVLTDDLPDYLAKLDGFVGTLAADVNSAHRNGYNLESPSVNGADFFTGTTAADLALAFTDPKKVAASASSGTLDASVAQAIANLDMGGTEYRSLVTDFGVTVASARRVAENQGILTSQVDTSRESLSGISIDEEMVNLLAAQRGYEAASRVITTLDSVLDTLINRTGLTR